MYPRRKKSRSKNDDLYLPDEIIQNILSRITTKDVVNCRSVCRRWRNLTSDIKFGCLPMILVMDNNGTKRYHDPLLLDDFWEITPRDRSTIEEFGHTYGIGFSDSDAYWEKDKIFAKRYDTLFSHYGLLVLKQRFSHVKCRSDYMIFNPINGENVAVSILKGIAMCDLYGVFFSPYLNEYCTLWGILLQEWPKEVEYRVLTLGLEPRWVNVINHGNKNARIQTVAPLFVGVELYWIVEAEAGRENLKKPVTLHIQIMIFNIVKQEVKTMHCPVDAVVVDNHGCNTHLINMEGCLSLVQLVRISELLVDIHIWTLKDRVQQSWECSKYRINLGLLRPRKFQFIEAGVLKPICASNGELAIQSNKSLLVYSLKRGTVRVMKGNNQRYKVLFFSHSMSFASLKNCKPKIYMDEKREVNKGEKKSPLYNSTVPVFDPKFSIRKM